MIYQYGSVLFPQEAWACFSEDDKYRYKLSRLIDIGKGKIVWCMLNPSTANAFILDPTLRKCLEFSKRWGFRQMSIINLYALRATNPKELYKVKYPIGMENDNAISGECENADMIICGWGQEKIVKSYNFDKMKKYFKNKHVCCLGTNKDDSPKHPLYLPYTTHLRSFSL